VAFLQALAQADAASDVDPVDHRGYIINVACRTADPAARDALFVRAQQLAEQWLGPAHEKTLEIEELRARYAVDPGEAIVRMTPVCARKRERAAVESSHCLCYERLAVLHEEVGAASEAGTAVAEALRCYADSSTTQELPRLHRIKLEAHAELLRGRYDEALAWLRRAEDGLQTHRELPWVALELADVALLRARSLEALGRGVEAIDPLREAIVTYDVNFSGTHERGPVLRRQQAQRLLTELEAQRRSSIANSSSQR
jgi:tetratricopeptide (TPR) repeat protein